MSETYEPFNNAEEVWFWFCGCLVARGGGLRGRGDYTNKPRGCEVGDIQQILKKMKSHSQISNRHLRVMFAWGGLFCSPYYDRRAKLSEIRLWEEAMYCFDYYLKIKGVL